MLGVCAGGITAAGLLGHLATAGDERFATVTFLVTLIDFEVPSQVGTFISAPVVAAAGRRSRSRGVCSAAASWPGSSPGCGPTTWSGTTGSTTT